MRLSVQEHLSVPVHLSKADFTPQTSCPVRTLNHQIPAFCHNAYMVSCPGLAGLACGIQLAKSNVSFRILEASDGVGGRVRTDNVEGFLLDRGFQIFLTSYPEAQAILDYEALDLRPFYAGGVVSQLG